MAVQLLRWARCCRQLNALCSLPSPPQRRSALDSVSLQLAEALAAARLEPPVFDGVRVQRAVHLPRLLPRRMRMNLRLAHQQAAAPEPAFNPALEDPAFGVRTDCRCA